MSIFIKGSKEERNIAELFKKFKDNKMMFDHIFDQHDNKLINKCLKELKNNLNQKDFKLNSIEEQTRKYLHVLRITKERFSNYFHWYSLEELMILNQLIKKFENELKQY